MSILAAIIVSLVLLFLIVLLTLIFISDLESDIIIPLIFSLISTFFFYLYVNENPSSSYEFDYQVTPIKRTMVDFDDRLIIETDKGVRFYTSERKYNDLEKAKYIVLETHRKNVFGNILEDVVDGEKSLILFKEKQLNINGSILQYPNE